MAADPITATLLVASAAATGGSIFASKNQARNEMAMLNAETERAKLEATDLALAQTQSFRKALASQLALSSLRGGSGGSLMRQFGAESIANFLKDQGVLDRKKAFIDVAAQSQQATIKGNQFSRNASAIGSLVGGGLQSVNLSSFTGQSITGGSK